MNPIYAIIFNVKNMARGELISVPARAFIRHAWNCLYQDFTGVETNDRTFTPQYTFRRTVENFRKAVMAYGETIRLFRTHRRCSTRKAHVPKEVLEQFPDLLEFSRHNYLFTLTQKLKDAYEAAKAEAEAHARAIARN